MDCYIEEIDKMLNSKEVDVDRVRYIVRDIFNELSIAVFEIPVGIPFIRLRINEENDYYDNLSKISYPPKEYATLQRASLVNKPLFYATIFSESQDINNPNYPRCTVLFRHVQR